VDQEKRFGNNARLSDGDAAGIHQGTNAYQEKDMPTQVSFFERAARLGRRFFEHLGKASSDHRTKPYL